MSKKKKKKTYQKEIKREPPKPKSFRPYYLIIASIIFLIFILIYGVRVLVPTNVNWIIGSGNDTMQHYIGWEAFRFGKWMFPIGVTDMVSYPLKISVIHTDAIPLLALFFKLISFMLPQKFQYIGLYALACYIIQGLLAAKIIKKYTDSKLYIISGATLFAIVPSMIFRVFYHTALSSHWLLLLALETIFLYDDFKEGKKIYYIWGLISFLTVTIHLYYLLMCGIILLGFIIYDILNTKKVKRSILVLLIYLIVGVLTICLLGGFNHMTGNDNLGFGAYSYNLNGLINSQGWSIFFKELPMIPQQYEGFSYLGLGVMSLALIAIAATIVWYTKDKSIFKTHKNLIFSIILITIISTIVALSPQAYLGDKLIYDIKLPETVTNLWAIFRSTGRLIWPVIHIIMLLCIIIIGKRINIKIATGIMIICVFLQAIDIGGVLTQQHSTYARDYTINEQYDLYTYDVLKQVADNKNIKTLVLVNDDMYDSDVMLFDDWAVNNRIKTNTMHFARTVFNTPLRENTEKLLQDIDNTKAYVFTTNEKCNSYHLHCYSMPNSFYLGYADELN